MRLLFEVNILFVGITHTSTADCSVYVMKYITKYYQYTRRSTFDEKVVHLCKYRMGKGECIAFQVRARPLTRNICVSVVLILVGKNFF